MKLGFLPIDNRPVCYTLPKQIAAVDNNIELCLPGRKYLGDLTKQADTDEIFKWLENLPSDLDGLILSLDTVTYGGLIPSRRCPETFDEIKTRIEKLKDILISKKCKIYAFSSIMRISNNNYNEEEKEYWSEWGKKIFEYSFDLHKSGTTPQNDIPEEILTDYISTRKRNFEINKIYLEWHKEGLFDTLIFSKDDCAQYGLNVMEAQELEKSGAFVKTGADEIPLSLLARAISGNIKICPIFFEPESKNLISNYEDISIEQCVKNQIELAGCSVADENNADILLYVNNFIKNQGEIVMGVDTQNYKGEFATPQKPYMIADVRFANGADNNFIREFFKNDIKDKNFYGYSGWNTSANTLGSLICAGKVKFLAKEFNKEKFENLQITRFLDDWAYQANVRQILKFPDVLELNKKMRDYEKIVLGKLNARRNIKYIYPWNRLFEVEIEFS